MTTSLFIALLLAIEPPADPASPVVTTSESPVAVASPTSTTEVVSTTATPDAVVTTTSTGEIWMGRRSIRYTLASSR